MVKISVILLLAMVMIAANAWWDRGHMLVSQIAYNHLTDTNRQNARDKLQKLV
jgi:hypothetical protein